ncbi:MAG: glycosyltransferase family 4 protein [Actinomycetia bacterium]|nr:glycosyltransferase family 4 protein [Actinomycetes bacterium]
MRILFLTQLFDPEPTDLKGLLFASELTKMGHQVRVLTCLPNYPDGRIYEAYRGKIWSHERVSGVEIFRLPLYPSHDRSALRRALCYLSYGVSSSAAVVPFGDTDVVHVHQGPATLAAAALVDRLIRRVPFVYDIQDVWPDSVKVSGMLTNRTLLAAAQRWCSFTYRRAAKITTLSPGMKRLLIARGVAESKVDVVYNWADETLHEVGTQNDALREQLGVADRFLIMYAGNMGPLQGLDSLLDAAALLRACDSRVVFLLVGTGTEAARLQSRARALGLSNVLFIDRQPPDAMKSLYSAADALFVQLKNTPLSAVTIPHKIQGYMAAGKPILAAIAGDSARLVKQAQAGVVCEPENAASIAEKARLLEIMSPERLRSIGAQGRAFYTTHLSMAAGLRHFSRIYQEAADQARSRAWQ